MEHDIIGKREEALSFLIDQQTGVLATVSGDGQPRARLIYYTCDDTFNVYFITLKSTRKVSDITANSRSAFVVSEADMPRTLQMEGHTKDLSDTAIVDPLLTEFVHRLMSHTKYGIPLARFDASELRFYQFTPEWIRWGDFTFGKGTDEVLTAIDPKIPEE